MKVYTKQSANQERGYNESLEPIDNAPVQLHVMYLMESREDYHDTL
jgi:hypothetical protein